MKVQYTRKSVVPYLLIAPCIIFLFLTLLFPLFQAIRYSFYNIQLIYNVFSWVGIYNYLQCWQSQDFQRAVWLTIYFCVFSLALELFLAYPIAYILTYSFKGRGIVRTLLILPWAVPTVVNGVMWKTIYDANYGLLNGILYRIGVINTYIPWLTSPSSAMLCVIIADVWKMTPFCVLLLLAGLQSISKEIREAAQLDGAGVLQYHLYVVLPLLRTTLLVLILLRTIDIFKAFDIFYVLTKGGPAGKTTVLGYLVYKEAFEFLRLGRASAIAVNIGLLVTVLGVLYYKLLKPQEKLF